MHRCAAAAVVASLALALPACGGGGPPATKADVEAQVRVELPHQLQQQQNQAALARRSLAFGTVVRVVATKCTPKAKKQFDCVADAIGSNGLGGYRSFTIDVSADCPNSHCSLRIVE
jgi:predicted small lipoprotein YifL